MDLLNRLPLSFVKSFVDNWTQFSIISLLTVWRLLSFHFDSSFRLWCWSNCGRCRWRHNWAVVSRVTKFTIAFVHVCARLFELENSTSQFQQSNQFNNILTPTPLHSFPLLSVGHLDVSMYGNRLTQVWFTQTKLSPQGVPSVTRPWL